MINKIDRVDFVDSVISHLIHVGATHTHELNDTHVCVLNSCTITVEPQEEHTQVYSIFCRFNDINNLTGNMNKKYNYHSVSGIGWKDHINSILNV